MFLLLERALRATGQEGDEALAPTIQGALQLRGTDIPPSQEASASRYSEESLEKAVFELKREPSSPERTTDFWQNFLAVVIKDSGAGIAVPEVGACDWTKEEITNEQQKGRGLVFKPGFTYPQLGKIFLSMGSWAVLGESSVADEQKVTGWVSTEMTMDAPFRNTTEDELKGQFGREGRMGATLETYVLASQANKILHDSFLDEGATFSRLLGSRDESQFVHAYFISLGVLRVNSDLSPDFRRPYLGGRSEGVK